MVKRPILFTIAAFTLAGPPVGLALCTAWDYLVVMFDEQTSAYSFLAFHDPFIYVAAYAFGSIPAATAGFLWAVAARQIALTRPLTRFLRLPVGAIIGGSSGFLFGVAGNHASNVFFLCGASTSLLALVFPLNRWLSQGLLTSAGPDGPAASIESRRI